MFKYHIDSGGLIRSVAVEVVLRILRVVLVGQNDCLAIELDRPGGRLCRTAGILQSTKINVVSSWNVRLPDPLAARKSNVVPGSRPVAPSSAPWEADHKSRVMPLTNLSAPSRHNFRAP